VLPGVAVILAAAASAPPQSGFRYALIVVLSLATTGGIQNATVRKLAVPDLTTTVLTLTVTGTDSALGGGTGSKSGRRLVAVAAMFVGALVGALLVLHVRIVPLAIALALVAVVALTSHRADASWTRAGG
jgi:uncharacterized membrane protein YoaK (UPF0700 family)